MQKFALFNQPYTTNYLGMLCQHFSCAEQLIFLLCRHSRTENIKSTKYSTQKESNKINTSPISNKFTKMVANADNFCQPRVSAPNLNPDKHPISVMNKMHLKK